MSCPYHYAMNISVVRVPAYPQIQFIITLIIRSSMRKRNGIYYYVYPCVYRDKKLTYLAYATSKSPLGPFTYQGVIIDNAKCDPNPGIYTEAEPGTYEIKVTCKVDVVLHSVTIQ